MAGRALAFSDPELVELVTNSFVPVTGDDWYQRRRNDDEGAFFRAVAGQGPRKGQGGSTRQGIYCLTASGKLLAYKNASDPEVMREAIRLGLARWKALPASERKPGAFEVPKARKVDANYTRTPPPGGLILESHTRILDRDGKGGFSRGTCKRVGGEQAARDHVWITREEWQKLIPSDPRKGQTFAMPAALADRFLRFHFFDNTRGEPDHWERAEVRKSSLTWTVAESDEKEILLRLDGKALLSTDADPAKAVRGFDLAVTGHLRYDVEKKAITRFDLLVVGDHWGDQGNALESRPGRQPLGLAFRLVAGKDAADRIPPQAARELPRYFGRER